MKIRIVLILLGLFLTLNCSSQTVFRGKILDETTQQPLEGAKVGINDQGVGVVTNSNGSFNYRKYQHAIGDRSELRISANGYDDLILKGAQIRALYNKSTKIVLVPNSDSNNRVPFLDQKNIAIYWDASLSSESRDFKKEWDFLEVYFSQLSTVSVKMYVFNEEIISEQEFSVNKDITILKSFIENIEYTGSTSYSILPKLDVDAVLLFSDGNPVLGEWQDVRETPYYLIASINRADDRYFRSLALYTSGSYINLSNTSISESIEQIKNGVAYKTESEIDKDSFKGIVRTTAGPIQGATITIKGDLEEFFTKSDGTFSIPAEEGDIIQVKFLGMYPKEMLVQKDTELVVELKPINELLEEVVLEGTKKRREKRFADTGFGDKNEDAIGTSLNLITSKDIRPNAQYLGDIIRGRFAGVTVNGFGSEAVFTIRGGTNNIPAIWVVDGSIYEQTPQWVDPQNISSISILKSLRATARYGSVASGGAFIVRTKTFAFKDGDGEIIDQALVKGNDYNEEVAQINLETLRPNYVKQLASLKSKEDQYKRYKNLLPANTTNAAFYIDMALHFQKVYPEKAVEIRSRLSEVAKSNSKVLRVLAYLYENAEEYNKALEVYKRVLTLAPGQAQSYRDLANAYEQTGDYDKSLELYINMLSEQVRGVNFKSIDKALSHELLRLISRHKERVDYTRLPEEWLLNEYRIDLRMVIEWSEVSAPFEFQFVNPQDKFFKWNHTLFDNKERLEDEVKSGFQFEEFIIDEAPHGLWRVNIEYLGEDTYTLIPPYLKYTIYRDYGTQEERKETIILKLSKEIGKAQLHEFLL